MANLDALHDLRFGDLVTFLEVQRCASITGAARVLNVTPSQVSKAVTRLEEQLHLVLLTRGSRGVGVSDAGRRIVPHIGEVLARLRGVSRTDLAPAPQLTIAAPSYLTTLFVPAIAAGQPELRVRGLELPPSLVRAHAAENLFDVALIIGQPRLPDSWETVSIGEVRKALFASPTLARRIGELPTVDTIRAIPFVSPVSTVNGQFVPAADDCPLHHDERINGHEAQTIGVALELAAHTDQLVFGPVIAARHHLDVGALVEIPIKGWNASEMLHLVCSGDRVLAQVQRALVATMTRTLHELDAATLGRKRARSTTGRSRT